MRRNAMPETTYHLHIDIEEFLNKPDHLINGMLADSETGLPLSPGEARAFLRQEQSKGFKYFTGCDNRNDDGSCAGHPAP